MIESHNCDRGWPNTFFPLDQVYHARWTGTLVVYIFLITSHNTDFGHMHIVHFGCVFPLWFLVFSIHRWNTNDMLHFSYRLNATVSEATTNEKLSKYYQVSQGWQVYSHFCFRFQHQWIGMFGDAAVIIYFDIIYLEYLFLIKS